MMVGNLQLVEHEILSPITSNNLSGRVYQVLRDWIVSQQFEPGHRLNLTELEDILQVSRTPLKTALIRLEQEGVVEIQARRGTFIAAPNLTDLEENYKIRSSFELYVALCLFKYLTAEDYTFFASVHIEMNRLVEIAAGSWQSIISEYLDLDRRFHQRMLEVGGTPRMVEMYQQMNIHHHMLSRVTHYSDRDFLSLHFEHEQILVSINDHSPERLNASLLNHLEAARYRALSTILPG